MLGRLANYVFMFFQTRNCTLRTNKMHLRLILESLRTLTAELHQPVSIQPDVSPTKMEQEHQVMQARVRTRHSGQMSNLKTYGHGYVSCTELPFSL